MRDALIELGWTTEDAIDFAEDMTPWIQERIAAARAQAQGEERAAIADWFEETFCPRSGVPGDETHARGDCDYCNMAAAIRRPGGAPDEGATG